MGVSFLVGVISDTHGLLRPEAVAALRGARHILHAGDVGAPEVLDGLRALAPVTAVRGNNDRGAWAASLPGTALIELGGARILVIHDVHDVRDARDAAVVIAGHSHVPRNEARDGVLWFNPGSAGPRRFKLPVTVGLLSIADGAVVGEIRSLSVAASGVPRSALPRRAARGAADGTRPAGSRRGRP
jgi:putative phosphoesterase